MSQVRFIADLHFGHESMALKRGFKSAEEHDQHIIKKWNSVVHKRDTVYILGDVTMEKSSNYHLLDELNGKKIVVLGNHDLPNHILQLLQHVEKVTGMIKYSQKGYKKVWLTHCPVHPSELEYRVGYNIHGHIHENNVMLGDKPDSRYICVSCEQVDYTPKLFTELVKKWNEN